MPQTDLSTVMERNAAFATLNRQAQVQTGEGTVCVFTGGSSGGGGGGLGARILERMVRVFHYPATFYVVGRLRPEHAGPRGRAWLELLVGAARCRLVFIDADVALVADMSAAGRRILCEQEKVDYLCMCTGGEPESDQPKYTREGLETYLAESYYGRMSLLGCLLPRLRRSPRARVLNVVDGGPARRLPVRLAGLPFADRSNVVMTNLALGHLAAASPGVAFVHSVTGPEPAPRGPLAAAAFSVGGALLRPLGAARRAVFSRSGGGGDGSDGGKPDEDVERHLYFLTIGPPAGEGPLFVSGGHAIPPSEAYGLAGSHADDWPGRVWDFTVEMCEKALATAAPPDDSPPPYVADGMAG